MIDHIGLNISDFARSRAFYEAALSPLGIRTIGTETNTLGNQALLMGDDEVFFVIADGEQPSVDSHVAFRASTAAEVDAFHAAALAAGGRDNGAPGLRPQYGGGYYAAFVYDHDGINVEAVCHLPASDDEEAVSNMG
jgi:catechol 2,3-dioxygenase-like lactoylglutathione lyase family enzyme